MAAIRYRPHRSSAMRNSTRADRIQSDISDCTHALIAFTALSPFVSAPSISQSAARCSSWCGCKSIRAASCKAGLRPVRDFVRLEPKSEFDILLRPRSILIENIGGIRRDGRHGSLGRISVALNISIGSSGGSAMIWRASSTRSSFRSNA